MAGNFPYANSLASAHWSAPTSSSYLVCSSLKTVTEYEVDGVLGRWRGKWRQGVEGPAGSCPLRAVVVQHDRRLIC